MNTIPINNQSIITTSTQEPSHYIPPPENLEKKLTRFRHPCHKHKLFINFVRDMAIFCDNKNCRRRLNNHEVSFVCFQCNFDLCAHCFALPTEAESACDLSDSDENVNEDILFQSERSQIRAKFVRLVPHHHHHQHHSSDQNDNQTDSDYENNEDDIDDEEDEEDEDEDYNDDGDGDDGDDGDDNEINDNVANIVVPEQQNPDEIKMSSRSSRHSQPQPQPQRSQSQPQPPQPQPQQQMYRAFIDTTNHYDSETSRNLTDLLTSITDTTTSSSTLTSTNQLQDHENIYLPLPIEMKQNRNSLNPQTQSQSTQQPQPQQPQQPQPQLRTRRVRRNARVS